MVALGDVHITARETDEDVQAARGRLAGPSKAAGDAEATDMLVVAKAESAKENFVGALQQLVQAMRIFQESGNKKGQAAAEHLIAKAQLAKQNAEEAVYKATAALKAFRQLADKQGEAAVLDTMARAHLAGRDSSKAMQAANNAMTLYKELKNKPKEGAMLCLIARIHLAEGHEEALAAAKDALAVSKDLGDKELISESLDAVVDAYFKKKEPDDALAAVTREVQSFKSAGDKQAEMEALLKAAGVHLRSADYDQAVQLAQEAQEASLVVVDKLGEGNARLLIAKAKLEQADYGEALQMAEGAMALFQGAEFPAGRDGELSAFEVAMGVHFKLGGLNEAFSTAVEAYKRFSGSREKKGEAAVLLSIADVHLAKGENDMALKALTTAGPLFSAVGDKAGEGDAWAKLASTYMVKKDAASALRAAQEAVAAFQKAGDIAKKASMLQAVAEVQFTLAAQGRGNGRLAQQAATEAAAIYQELQDKAAEATSLHILANAQLMLRNFPEATSTAKAAQAIFQDMGDTSGEASTLLLVAGAHLGAGEYDEAKLVAKDAGDLYKQREDEQGDDSVEDFLDSLKDYESGKLRSEEFAGFSMQAEGSRKPRQKEKGKAAPAQGGNKADVYTFGTNPQGQRDISWYCDSYEGRAATAPGARPGGRSEKNLDSGGYRELDAAATKEQALYVVRYVPLTENDVPRPDPAAEAAPKPRVKVEETRIAEAANFGMAPGRLMRTGHTSRMLEAVGAQRR